MTHKDRYIRKTLAAGLSPSEKPPELWRVENRSQNTVDAVRVRQPILKSELRPRPLITAQEIQRRLAFRPAFRRYKGFQNAQLEISNQTGTDP
jgi:hypothetical protein